MATTRSSTAALYSAIAEAASYGRSKLKEEREEVTELTERLKVARGSFVAQWRRRIDGGDLRWLKMRTKGETALQRLRAPAEATSRRSRPWRISPTGSAGAGPPVAAGTTKTRRRMRSVERERAQGRGEREGRMEEASRGSG